MLKLEYVENEGWILFTTDEDKKTCQRCHKRPTQYYNKRYDKTYCKECLNSVGGEFEAFNIIDIR